MLTDLLKLPNVRTQFCRWYGKHNKKFLYKDGQRYERVIYYPRHENHEDPPVTPAKLFRVQRIKPMKGNPFWEKKLLKEFGIHEKLSDVAIVKNIPENNARLWKIKHLVKITPITFPYGEPTDNDIYHTILRENGECLVTKEIKIDEKRIQATEVFETDPTRLDPETLKKDSRLKWLNPW